MYIPCVPCNISFICESFCASASSDCWENELALFTASLRAREFWSLQPAREPESFRARKPQSHSHRYYLLLPSNPKPLKKERTSLTGPGKLSTPLNFSSKPLVSRAKSAITFCLFLANKNAISNVVVTTNRQRSAGAAQRGERQRCYTAGTCSYIERAPKKKTKGVLYVVRKSV